MEYGLIGESLSHSFSPFLHKMLGNYKYELKEIDRKSLAGFYKQRDFKGINITNPYKKISMDHLDIISEEALEAGSVNTVVNKNGVLHGYNTDIYGVEYTLKKDNIDLSNKNVLILGSGGASCAAVHTCKKHGAKNIGIVSRSGPLNYVNMYDHNWNILINATPVGMFPENDAVPADPGSIDNLEYVFDMIYNPINTRLILAARSLGIKTRSGSLMLAAQAHRAGSLFLGRDINETNIETMAESLGNAMSNIVFIGMPGCGKTTIGRLYAKSSGKRWFDSDAAIRDYTGMEIPDIFKNNGEAFFRQRESEIIRDISRETGAVISVGGGSVLDKNNIYALKQNGIIVYLKRDIEKLVTEGRPNSVGGIEKLKELYDKRKNLYEKYADHTVDANGTPDETVKKLKELFQ